MATIPESQHTTAHAIVKWYESKPQDHRPHMGASLIGHPCDRHIWLTWRWAMKPTFPGRILRLFSTGQREESRILEELRGIGATVWDVDPESKQQWRISAFNGHFGGSLDAVAKGLPEAPKTVAVLEFKTHSNKSFTDLCKHKVKASKPQHYDQMTVYMGKMELDRALYIAVNKDTDDLYTEWVHFDQDRYDMLMQRAQFLIESPMPPERLSADPAYFQCKMCSFWKHCHGGMAAEANCRTCCHASPVANSQWRCEKNDANVSEQIQRDGCAYHLLIPALVPYGDPVDGGDSYVVYKHRDTGAMFVNGPEGCSDYGPVFSSKELQKSPGSLLAQISELKTEFPGSKVESGSVKAPVDWGDIASMEEDIPLVAPDKPSKKADREKIKAAAKAMEAMKK